MHLSAELAQDMGICGPINSVTALLSQIPFSYARKGYIFIILICKYYSNSIESLTKQEISKSPFDVV